MNKIGLKYIGIVLMSFFSCGMHNAEPVSAQLRNRLHQLIDPFRGVIGVSVVHIEKQDTLTIHNGLEYPMQSVYKFPLAIAVLHEVDKGKLTLQQKIHITKNDLHPNTWSPLATQYPEGNIDVTIAELLDYTVSKSDNNTCDVLFRVMGGTKKVEQYIHELGYHGISIKTTEEEMAKVIDSAEKKNWCYPSEMTRMLTDFLHQKHLSKASNDVLMRLMIESSNSNKRIKGSLPQSVMVAHKTGTGNRIVNDVGIVTLPDGNHLALAVYVKQSQETFEDAEKIIAQISRTVYDYYATHSVLSMKIDSILYDTSLHPFNGIVLVAKKNNIIHSSIHGFSDLYKKVSLKPNSQFVIGSISKQITAVMVLQEYEKGHLQLDVPIKEYLPDLKMSWADTVTVHHLLTHMHGISDINKPILFEPGTQFNYGLSDVGYRLLSQIVARVSGKSFMHCAADLFLQCGMKHTFHPDLKQYQNLAKGYTQQDNGAIEFETESFQNSVAAGGFISTANDLVIWNENLHQGKLLKPETYQLMISPKNGAIRQHPIFGQVKYGYGITVHDQGTIQLGQTGFAPGFVSMSFYFPQTQTSVVVLENIVHDSNDLKKTFYHHIQILEQVKKVIDK